MEIKDAAFAERIKRAKELTAGIFGNRIFIRGIIEFSNICRKNCRYCGIRRGNRNVKRYRMTPEEIIAAANADLKIGIKTIVLQSGEDIFFSKDVLIKIIEGIKKLDPGCAVTLSIGERPPEEYAAFKEAGAERFFMRFETSDEKLFKELHPDDDFCSRLKSLENLKKLGYETGSGFMIGIPGEEEDADDKNIKLLKEIGVHMAGSGPFIPAVGTPMENDGIRSDIGRCLDVYAKMRIALPKANIAASTALDVLDKRGRELVLSAGANVIMPNTTPLKYRDDYVIYIRKGKLDENFANAGFLGNELKACGYEPMWDEKGTSLLMKEL